MINFQALLKPKTIAIVGASPNRQKLGGQILSTLLKSRAKLYPVNPNYQNIHKLACYPDLASIPADIDQAVIAIPAAFVAEVVAQAVAKNIPILTIITAGFSESGADGKILEDKIKATIKNSQTRILGPNCFGLANPAGKLDLTFAKNSPPEGSIGLISQSGAIGSYLFDWAKKENLGFSSFFSLGNKADLNENDLLSYLSHDPSTKVIGIYLESFADGSQFLREASLASKHKPVVVIFGGQTKSGSIASSSHTASLSPKPVIIKTALKNSQVITAESLGEFTDLLELFSHEPKLTDNDLAIVTNAGGPSILATDTADTTTLNIHPLSAKTKLSLTKFLPSSASIANPIDLLGDAGYERFQKALQVLVADSIQDAFLIILTPQTSTDFIKTAQAVVTSFKSSHKPVVVSILSQSASANKAKQYLSQNHIATIDFPQKAVIYLDKIYTYYSKLRTNPGYPPRQAIRKLAKKSFPFSIRPSWKEITVAAKYFSLPLVETHLVNHSNLSSVIKKIGYPFVLKIDASLAAHRTEVKGLYLNIKSIAQAQKALKNMDNQFAQVLAQPQILEGHELFIGFLREDNFPPLLTLGSGGIYTELYQDVAHSFLPLNKELIKNLLLTTKVGQILAGYRGSKPYNLQSVIKLILHASWLFLDNPQLESLEINPAIISHSSLKIVDIKLSVAKPPSHP